jgi:hypothetical protein
VSLRIQDRQRAVDQIKLFTKAAVMPSTILTGNNFAKLMRVSFTGMFQSIPKQARPREAHPCHDSGSALHTIRRPSQEIS